MELYSVSLGDCFHSSVADGLRKRLVSIVRVPEGERRTGERASKTREPPTPPADTAVKGGSTADVAAILAIWLAQPRSSSSRFHGPNSGYVTGPIQRCAGKSVFCIYALVGRRSPCNVDDTMMNRSYPRAKT